MSDSTFHSRIKDLYRMLFEMATGNLSFRLPPEENGDDLSRLMQSLSVFAGQFQLAIKKSGHVVPFYTYQNLAQLIIILDSDFSMIAFSSQVPILLGYTSEELFGAPFEAVLTDESQKLWNQAAKCVFHDDDYHETLNLTLIGSARKMKPTFCTISRLLYSETIFINSITTNLLEIAELNRNAQTQEKPSDAVLIQNLYEYIMSNLDKPLPTLKELALLFNTNEFRLKEGFRYFFNTSIYQFYNEERLKRAHLLIEQSNLPLKTVAFTSGFKDYVTFTKAFKKRFGYGPGAIIRTGL